MRISMPVTCFPAKGLVLVAALGLMLIWQVPARAQQWTLEACQQYALAHNRELLSGAQAVRVSALDRKAARAKLAPEVEARTSLDHYWQIPVQVLPGELIGQPGTFTPVRMGTPWMGSYGLEASLKLVDVPAWQNIRVAALQQQAAHYQLESLQRVLLKHVERAYYQVQLQQEHLATAARIQESYREIHRLISLQYAKGLTDKITLNQSLGLLNERAALQVQAKGLLQTAYLDLKFWMGYPLEEPLQVPAASKIGLALPAAFSPSLLPDYEQQKQRVAIARQQYVASRAPLYPSLHLTSSYRKLGFGDKVNFLTAAEWFTAGFVGIQLRVPLFSPGSMSFKPGRQKLLWQQADLAFADYQDRQHKNYLEAVLLLDQGWQRVQVQEENVQLAEENERLARQKIARGIIDMIQLKQVEQDLYGAQDKLREARHDYLTQYVEVKFLQNN